MPAPRARDRLTPGTNLKAWLFRILHDRHLPLRGRRHRAAEVGVDDPEPCATVPAFQEGRAELRHLKAAFARLPASQREPLVLWAVHGGSPRSAAARSARSRSGNRAGRTTG
jgi:RNA polymerase sigma-70 factor (ECF subfamily)